MSLPSFSVETTKAAADIEYSAQNMLHAKIVQPYAIQKQEFILDGSILMGQTQTDENSRDKQKKRSSKLNLRQVHSRRLEVCYYCYYC